MRPRFLSVLDFQYCKSTDQSDIVILCVECRNKIRVAKGTRAQMNAISDAEVRKMALCDGWGEVEGSMRLRCPKCNLKSEETP